MWLLSDPLKFSIVPSPDILILTSKDHLSLLHHPEIAWVVAWPLGPTDPCQGHCFLKSSPVFGK